MPSVKRAGVLALFFFLSIPGLRAGAQKPKLEAAATPAAPVTLEERRKALDAVFKDYWYQYLRYNPEFASSIGDMRFNDQLHDYSVKAFNEWQAREEDYLLQLGAIDPAGLGDQEQLSREMLIRELADDLEGSRFKEWEMPITQMGGIYSDMPQLVAELSFKTEKDYEDWIARLRAMPDAFNQVMTNMEIGVEDGRVPPKYLLAKALENIKMLAGQKAEDSPLALPLKNFPASMDAPTRERLKAEMLGVITRKDLPAYQQLVNYMERSYVPAGRAEPGISALPDGKEYYAFLLRRTTTTDLSAEKIHQIGLDEVKRDEAEMLAIAVKLGYKDMASFRAAVKADPKLKASSREALLEAYRKALAPMQARLPELFGHLPKEAFEVVAVPDYLEKTSAMAYYQPGTLDGSRPGRLFIDTYNATDRNLYSVEDIAYHEGLPGHHLQISIAQELEGVPAFRRYGNYTAYAEGWGLYSERLGKDIGLYTDPYSDYGRLEGDIWRSIRLVVDTGVHSEHWTREQMVDFFHEHSTIDETSIQAEVDRYVAWPSQACAYKIGQLKILELRDKAKKELGGKFDIRAFHDEVLDSGAMPLDLLEQRVDAWIAAVKGK